MSKFKATPLFDAHKTFVRLPMGMMMLNDYPDSKRFIDDLIKTNADISQDFLQTQAFLKSYSRKSEATYRSYRNEVERLLLWSWTIANKSIIQLKRPELEAFFDFVHSPPVHWVGESVQDRFKQIGGQWLQNEFWRPFAAKISKEDRKKAIAGGLDVKPDTKGHTLSGEAIKICFSAISCFYDYLADEGYAFGNPIPAIRKQSPYLIKGATQKNIKRLS
ncbi:MAG: site-specific integrase, partial [Porticoccaceae bacterium]